MGRQLGVFQDSTGSCRSEDVVALELGSPLADGAWSHRIATHAACSQSSPVPLYFPQARASQRVLSK